MTEKELLLTSVLNCRRVDLYAQPVTLTAAQESELARMTTRLEQDEPVQYIVGECEFMGLKLNVDKRVLIPRPETELLVEAVVNFVQQKKMLAPRILDLGTGSGNIAISLAKFLPTSSIVTVDVSGEALEIARANAQLNEVSERIGFVHDNMANFLKKWTPEFDIIISNPPYIPNAQLTALPRNVQCEPVLALDGGIDGLNYYRLIVENIKNVLSAGGQLFFEIGDGQRATLEEILAQNKIFQDIEFIQDYRQTDRIVSATVSQHI